MGGLMEPLLKIAALEAAEKAATETEKNSAWQYSQCNGKLGINCSRCYGRT